MNNAGFRVLVAEDEATFGLTVARALKNLNHDVKVCPSGKATLKALDTTEWDVLLLDLKLPDADGVDILARVRKEYDAAERYYREALELAREQDLKEPQAYISGNLGLLALYREQWAEARQWFEQEFPLAREIGRVSLIAQAQYGLARVWEAEGRSDLALPLAQ